MDDIILYLLAAGLFVAWLIGPILVLRYWWVVVPRRYEEIRERFTSNNPGEQLAPQDDRALSGAWHYVRLLDPDVQLKNEAEAEAALKRQFDYFHSWDKYAAPFYLTLVLSGIMLAFSGLWLVEKLDTPEPAPVAAIAGPPVAPAGAEAGKPAPPPERKAAEARSMIGRIPAPFVMALWGAYVWSLYEILSRRRSGDLTPAELYDIASRYLTALPLGYAFSLMAFNTVPSLAAFAISAFPLRDIRQFFRKQALSKMDNAPAAPAVSATTANKGLIGDTLCGVGNTTIARLEELNLETYLDLAYADPIKLLVQTGVPIELVLSWIDQSLISVYAAPHKTVLAQYGLPCALDVCEFYARHCWDVAQRGPKQGWETDPAVVDLANKLGLPPVFLVQQILRSIFEDPHTQFLIRVWFGQPKRQDDL